MAGGTAALGSCVMRGRSQKPAQKEWNLETPTEWPCCSSDVTIAVVAAERDYPHQPVPFTDVKLTDSFWKPRIETNRTVTIPYAFGKSEETGRIENFKVAGGLSKKAWTGGYGFNDSDVSKIIEGASYCLSVQDDPKLDAYLEKLISWYAAAQWKPGDTVTVDWPMVVKRILCNEKVEADLGRVASSAGPSSTASSIPTCRTVRSPI